jgi:type VI secretion system protein ImpL
MIWVGLVALLLLAAVWTAALLLGWHLAIPVLVTVSILALLGLLFGLRWLRSKRRAAELDAQLRRQKRSSDSSDSADAEVVLELQGRLRELAAALRRGASSKSLGDSSLYTIPWYLILGPPGAGKSTALDASGLPLSVAAGRAPKSRRHGPTKGWEPWLSEEGVLIDTAGAYSVGDAEQESSALLATLRRARRKRPLDGVVLTSSLSERASDRPEQH